MDAVLTGLDIEINEAGMRGSVLGRTAARRSRSTKRRQDAPDLPKRKMENTTLGRIYNGYRPSLFVTLTLPSYGKVRNGSPLDPDTYDYAQAARDALHFSKLIDRFVQNLRRVAGYDVQYFATVEPQKRLVPHLHTAIRGTLSRSEIRQIAAAIYHQVWWPQADEPVDFQPVWAEDGYLDANTGEYLPTWDEALDNLGDEPAHVIRFGDQVDVKGVLAGSPDADQCIRYLSKYLTKSLGGPMRRSGFNRLAGWVEAARSIGVPNLHVHDLRHTGNMFAAGSGAGLKDLMNDTVRAAMIYQHAVRGADKAITEAIDKHLIGHARARDQDEDDPPDLLVPTG